MREYSEKFHQIFSWENHPDNYEKILINLITFIKVYIIKIFQLFVDSLMCNVLYFQGETKDHNDVYNCTLNLPYLYTLEKDSLMDMMKIKNSLDKLYTTVFPHRKFNKPNIDISYVIYNLYVL